MLLNCRINDILLGNVCKVMQNYITDSYRLMLDSPLKSKCVLFVDGEENNKARRRGLYDLSSNGSVTIGDWKQNRRQADEPVIHKQVTGWNWSQKTNPLQEIAILSYRLLLKFNSMTLTAPYELKSPPVTGGSQVVLTIPETSITNITLSHTFIYF